MIPPRRVPDKISTGSQPQSNAPFDKLAHRLPRDAHMAFRGLSHKHVTLAPGEAPKAQQTGPQMAH